MTHRICDELEAGFGWVLDERLVRASHALAADGGVWVVDPVDADGIDERIRALGEPRGVVQTLDRHGRDCRRLGHRLGVPVFEVPFGGVPGAPFEVVPVVRTPVWREVALWWPRQRVLVCGDALGTAPYFTAPGERIGPHPFLRPLPPRRLATLAATHVLVGHGEGVHGDDAAEAVRDALAHARRRLPGALASALRRDRGGAPGRLRRDDRRHVCFRRPG